MAKKKEPDKLAQDAAAALAAGMSYGRWKAMQGTTVPEKKVEENPADWQACPHCGKLFKKKKGSRKIYCEPNCQMAANQERRKEKQKEYYRAYQERKRAEQKGV